MSSILQTLKVILSIAYNIRSQLIITLLEYKVVGTKKMANLDRMTRQNRFIGTILPPNIHGGRHI